LPAAGRDCSGARSSRSGRSDRRADGRARSHFRTDRLSSARRPRIWPQRSTH
jgi:hypothetical protein